MAWLSKTHGTFQGTGFLNFLGVGRGEGKHVPDALKMLFSLNPPTQGNIPVGKDLHLFSYLSKNLPYHNIINKPHPQTITLFRSCRDHMPNFIDLGHFLVYQVTKPHPLTKPQP